MKIVVVREQSVSEYTPLIVRCDERRRRRNDPCSALTVLHLMVGPADTRTRQRGCVLPVSAPPPPSTTTITSETVVIVAVVAVAVVVVVVAVVVVIGTDK